MRRSRPGLHPPAPAAGEEDDATWMITFSDLVLLLLSFLAVGVLTGRGGPSLAASRDATLRPVVRTERAAAPPARHAAPVATAATTTAPAEQAARRASRRLRTLAGRLAARLAAESLPGLAPIVVRGGEIVVAVREGGVAADAGIGPVVAALAPVAAPLPPPAAGVLDASLTHPDLALARLARIVHELAAADPTLEVRTADDRVAVRARS